MDAQATVAANLKIAASARGLTMQRLADAAALSGGYLSEVLAGKKSPTLRTLARLCAVLQLDVIDLFRDDLGERLASKPAARPKWRTPQAVADAERVHRGSASDTGEDDAG